MIDPIQESDFSNGYAAKRIETLSNEVYSGLMVLNTPSLRSSVGEMNLQCGQNFDTVEQGMESLAQSIRSKTDTIIDLRDDAIIATVNSLRALYDLYRDDKISEIGIHTATIKDVINKDYGFVDRISFAEDKEVIAKLRQPVITTYRGMFKPPRGIGQPTVDDFGRCLDFKDLATTLSGSEWLGFVPKLFTQVKGLEYLTRLSELLESIDQGLDTQTKDIETVLRAAITELVKGDEIAIANKIDLDKSKIVSMGVELTPDIINTINKTWHGNNLSGTFRGMDKNTEILLEDAAQLIHREESSEPEDLKNLMSILTNPEFINLVQQLQRQFITLTDKISLTSKQLVLMSEDIAKVPIKKTIGYYSNAVEDIAQLMSTYSGQLYVILTFVKDLALGLYNGIINVENLAQTMRSHQRAVENYISVRRNKNVW